MKNLITGLMLIMAFFCLNISVAKASDNNFDKFFQKFKKAVDSGKIDNIMPYISKECDFGEHGTRNNTLRQRAEFSLIEKNEIVHLKRILKLGYGKANRGTWGLCYVCPVECATYFGKEIDYYTEEPVDGSKTYWDYFAVFKKENGQWKLVFFAHMIL